MLVGKKKSILTLHGYDRILSAKILDKIYIFEYTTDDARNDKTMHIIRNANPYLGISETENGTRKGHAFVDGKEKKRF